MSEPQDAAPPRLALTIDEVRLFINALVAARDNFSVISRAIALEFGISRRGPWIIGMIGHSPTSPAELASRMRIARSHVTAELNALQEADLIRCARSERDGRRVDLSLTARGEQANRRISDEFAAFVAKIADRHSRDQILAAARLLGDLAHVP